MPTRTILYEARFKRFDQALAKLDALNKVSDEAVKALAEMAAREKRLEAQTKRLADSTDRIAKEVKSFADAMKDAGDETERSERKVKRLGGVFTELNSAAELVKKGIRGVQRVMDAMSVPVGLAIDFERQFNMIRTLSDDVGDDLRQGLLDLAARVPQTAGDITQAAYQAISSGIEPPDVTPFLEQASRLAIAGDTDLTTAVTALTTAMNAYKAQGLEATEAAGVLLRTVQQGITTIPELASSLGTVASKASDAGAEFAEVGAVLAMITKKQGGLTPQAATQFRALMTAMTAPKREAAVYKEIGFQAGFAEMRSRGFAESLAQLDQAVQANGKEMGALFGRVEAGAAALQITGDNAAEFAEVLGKVKDSAGATAGALKKVEGDAQNLIANVKALGEALLRQLGEAALPHVKAGLEEIMTIMQERGPEFVAAFESAVDAAVDLATWVARYGPAIVEFVVAAFAASRVIAFATAIHSSLLPALAVLGTGGGLAGAFKTALRSAPVVGVFVAAGAFLARELVETIFDVWDAEAHRHAEQFKKDLLRQTKEFQAELSRMGFDSKGQAMAARDKVNEGGALGFGQRLDGETFGKSVQDVYRANLEAAGDAADAKAQALEATSAAVFADINQRAARVAELEQQQATALGAADKARTKASKRFKRGALESGNKLLAEAERGRDVAAGIRGEIDALKQSATVLSSALQDIEALPEPKPTKKGKTKGSGKTKKQFEAERKRREAEMKRAAAAALRLRREIEDRELALVQDASARAVAELQLRHQRELEDFKGSHEARRDLVVVQLDEMVDLKRRHIDDAATAELAAERRQAELIEDEFDRRLELLLIERDVRIRLAKETGDDVVAIHAHYEGKIGKVFEEQSKKRREAFAADVQAVTGAVTASLDAVDSFAETFGASEELRAGIKVGINVAEAVEQGALAYAAFAGGNITGGIGHTAAAAGHVAASIEWGKVAGGGGGGASAGGGSSGGGGAGRASTDRQTLRAGDSPTTSGAGERTTIIVNTGQSLATERQVENAVVRATNGAANRTGRTRARLSRLSR